MGTSGHVIQLIVGQFVTFGAAGELFSRAPKLFQAKLKAGFPGDVQSGFVAVSAGDLAAEGFITIQFFNNSVRVNNILNNGEKIAPLESRLQPVPGLYYRLKPRLQLFNIILTPTNFSIKAFTFATDIGYLLGY